MPGEVGDAEDGSGDEDDEDEAICWLGIGGAWVVGGPRMSGPPLSVKIRGVDALSEAFPGGVGANLEGPC